MLSEALKTNTSLKELTLYCRHRTRINDKQCVMVFTVYAEMIVSKRFKR